MNKEIERSKEIARLSFKAYQALESYFEEFAKEINNPIELSHFLSGLDNRLAITLSLKITQKGLEE